MKNLLYAALILITFYAQAQADQQAPQTLFGGLSVERVAGFGGPWLAFTDLKGKSSVMIGGKFGAVFNDKIGFGLIGMGFGGRMKFRGDNLLGNTNANLKANYGAGGIFLEYMVNLPKLVHLTFPVNIMVGGVKVEQDITSTNSINNNDKDDDITIESDGFVVLEPGLNLELNVSKYLILGGNVSYRYVSGANLKNISESDLSGLSFGVVVKFGNLLNPLIN